MGGKITNTGMLTPGLGNILFRYAALIGLADSYDKEAVIPQSDYFNYFERVVPQVPIEIVTEVTEPCFEYEATGYYRYRLEHVDVGIDVTGYFQSAKYWENSLDKVKPLLTFRAGIEHQIMLKFKRDGIFSRPTIGIHVRRGDYVGNPNYVNLPITYYISALEEFFPDYSNYNIILFSDDLAYCRTHFDCIPNVTFSDGTDIEDLIVMHNCDNLILSNSTFSWWGAYLGKIHGKRKGKVIRPEHYFEGKLAGYDTKDFWEPEWTSYSHLDSSGYPRKLDLKDCTFTIPVQYDSPDRLHNAYLSVDIIRKNFDTNIVVTENSTVEMYRLSTVADYRNSSYTDFHRTKMLNDMCIEATTDIIINWDADVIVPPFQLLQAVRQVRRGVDMCYPYDGRFARVHRRWYAKIQERLDVGVLGGIVFNGMGNADKKDSKGGAVVLKRSSYIEAGMENENFVSFSPEDSERFYRFNKLGYVVTRVNGPIYHVDHWCGFDSSTANPKFKDGYYEYQSVIVMSREELLEYISTWEHVKRLK